MAQSEFTGREGVSDGRSLMRLERVYLKDASFESPASPAVFTESWQPEISLEINTRSKKIGDEHYEVVLTVTVETKTGGRTAFIAEIQQAALFLMRGLEPSVLHRTLGTVCPTTLFPYVRETVDSLVVRGGFPPLHLAPMNFDAAYKEAIRQSQVRPATH